VVGAGVRPKGKVQLVTRSVESRSMRRKSRCLQCDIRAPGEVRRSSASSASRPPSPSLSEPSRSPTYNAVTTSRSAQMTSEVIPYTVVRDRSLPSPRMVRIA
jgi:hypothetical protein